jgi:hypothetical protein
MKKIKDQYTKDVYADIAKYIVPERSTLFDDEQRGQSFGKDVYDGWPGYCQRKMVTAMYGSLCPQNTNWMELQLQGDKPPTQISRDLHQLNYDMMMLLSKTNFYGNQSQFIGDGCAFGNSVQYIKDDTLDDKTKFITIHPAQYYLYTDEDGDVKAVLRQIKLNIQDIIHIIKASSMGEEDWKKCVPDNLEMDAENSKLEEMYAYHIIYERKYFRGIIDMPAKYAESPFVGVWYLSENGKSGDIFAIDRHDYFPYVAWRYQMESGWPYGFGPGHYALHDARVLQQLARANLEAGQRAAAPPVQAPEELKNKVKNRPYGITYYEDSSRMVQPLYTMQNWTQAKEVLDQKRQIVSFHYLLDVWQTLSEITARMTAYEVAERIGEKLAMISSVIGNFLNEGLSKQLRLFFALEVNAGRLKITPALQEYIQKEGIKIEFTSLLAQSLKKHLENQGLMRTMSEMQLAFEVNPELRMAFDWYTFAERMIKGSTTSLEILKDKRTYQRELEELEKQKQMAMQKEALQLMGGQNAQGMV